MEEVVLEKKAMQASEDLALIAKVLEGHTEYYAQIMRKYNQRLYRIAIGAGISDSYCEDILQETYISAYQHLHTFKGESSFSTWLVRILINHCRMHQRSQKRKGYDFMDDMSKLPVSSTANDHVERHVLKGEVERALTQALSELNEQMRSVYMMRELEDMSVRETAEALDISEANVKVLLHRAKQHLKEKLYKEMGEPELYVFGNARCDRVVQNVMEQILSRA